MSKVVLITGASSGLGQALAQQLAGKGYRVYGTSRQPRSNELPYQMLAMDVRDEASVRQAIAAIVEKECRLDAVINNAGIGIAGPLEQTGLGNIEKVLDTNVKGPIRVIQAALPHLRQSKGRVLNISSIGALFGLPYRGVYCASKAAVDLLTEALRMELSAFGVQACSIHAGDIRTGINANRIRDYDPQDPTYKERFERVYANIDKDVEKGLPAEEVARQVIRALESPRLRRYYTIGKPLQRLSILARRLLPAPLFERIIRGYSGMG
ncbi:MAG: SDR family oxidoreductase [Lewinellaceae bacterium]|nr:SDR family oxidoreductase [Lewinellaceae bacterium]